MQRCVCTRGIGKIPNTLFPICGDPISPTCQKSNSVLHAWDSNVSLPVYVAEMVGLCKREAGAIFIASDSVTTTCPSPVWGPLFEHPPVGTP